MSLAIQLADTTTNIYYYWDYYYYYYYYYYYRYTQSKSKPVMKSFICIRRIDNAYTTVYWYSTANYNTGGVDIASYKYSYNIRHKPNIYCTWHEKCDCLYACVLLYMML